MTKNYKTNSKMGRPKGAETVKVSLYYPKTYKGHDIEKLMDTIQERLECQSKGYLLAKLLVNAHNSLRLLGDNMEDLTQ